MTAIQPPLGITTLTDGTPAQHPAASFRRMIEVLAGGQTGVREAGDLAVTANGTPNMTVNVAAGEALIPGTQQPASQGAYYVYNDGSVSVPIAASDATNPRRDLIVARVYDRDYSGTLGEWRIERVAGTPAVSPVDPATPADSILLARVAVAAGATSISSGNITDLRSRLGQKAWLAAARHSATCSAATSQPPASPWPGKRSSARAWWSPPPRRPAADPGPSPALRQAQKAQEAQEAQEGPNR